MAIPLAFISHESLGTDGGGGRKGREARLETDAMAPDLPIYIDANLRQPHTLQINACKLPVLWPTWFTIHVSNSKISISCGPKRKIYLPVPAYKQRYTCSICHSVYAQMPTHIFSFLLPSFLLLFSPFLYTYKAVSYT